MLDSHAQRRILASILLDIVDCWVDYEWCIKYNNSWGKFGHTEYYAPISQAIPATIHKMHLTCELEGIPYGQ